MMGGSFELMLSMAWDAAVLAGAARQQVTSSGGQNCLPVLQLLADHTALHGSRASNASKQLLVMRNSTSHVQGVAWAWPNQHTQQQLSVLCGCREASDQIKKGKMCSLFINDLDAGAGRMGEATQYTVNNQMVNATLMNIADNPTNVQLPGVYKNEEIPRVPIICTGEARHG
jgi:hypothetical protein